MTIRACRVSTFRKCHLPLQSVGFRRVHRRRSVKGGRRGERSAKPVVVGRCRWRALLFLSLSYPCTLDPPSFFPLAILSFSLLPSFSRFFFLPCVYSSASVHRLFSTSLTFSLLPVSPLLSRVSFVFFFPFVSFPLENHQLAACTFDVARRQRAEYRKRPARRVRARRKGKGKRARVP